MLSMSKHRKRQWLYVLFDYLSAMVAWLMFLAFRWVVNDGITFGFSTVVLPALHLVHSLLLYPLLVIIVHYLTGYYLRPYKLTYLYEIWKTLIGTFFIGGIAFVTIILNDPVSDYTVYYRSLIALWAIQFCCSYPPRLLHSYLIKRKNPLQKKQSLVVGDKSLLPRLPLRDIVGEIKDINSWESVLKSKTFDEVIIALHNPQPEILYPIISKVYPSGKDISMIPNTMDFLTGAAKVKNLTSSPLVSVTDLPMADWKLCFKRAFDVVSATVSVVLLSPLLALIAILVKSDSKGPVLYKQQRIGRRGKPFVIYKFRTMVANAESGTPMLAEKEDKRITKVGHWLRKYRLDELPQLWNIIKGDMSVVGPRPEREFFIRQIEQKAPYYCLLYKVRPGLTSWGQIKVGYADTIDKMIERLDMNIAYINNTSLTLDIKIIIYTFGILIDGRGQ